MPVPHSNESELDSPIWFLTPFPANADPWAAAMSILPRWAGVIAPAFSPAQHRMFRLLGSESVDRVSSSHPQTNEISFLKATFYMTKELTQLQKTYLYSNVFSGRFQDLTQAQRKGTNENKYKQGQFTD